MTARLHYLIAAAGGAGGTECGRWVPLARTSRDLSAVNCRGCLVQLRRASERGFQMVRLHRSIIMLLVLLAMAPAVQAACPAQPASVNASTGSARICVPATADAPITRVDVTFTAGGVSRSVNFGPPAGQSTFAADFTFAITIPEELRGTGTSSLTSTGPGGTSGVASVATTFRPFVAPASPVLLAP